MARWSPDDYSEFAEALDAVCMPLSRAIADDELCPLGALIGRANCAMIGFPRPYEVSQHAQVPCSVAAAFAAGFDGQARLPRMDKRAFELGQSFAWRYCMRLP